MYEMSVGLNRRLCSGLAWLFSRVPGHSDLPAVSMARLRSASCSRDDTNPVLNMFPFKEKVMLYPNLRQTRCHLKSNGWCSSFLGTRSKNWSGKTASSGDSVPWSYSVRARNQWVLLSKRPGASWLKYEYDRSSNAVLTLKRRQNNFLKSHTCPDNSMIS